VKAIEALVLIVSLGLFVAGVLLPMMIIHPGYGDHSDLVAFFLPDLSAARPVSLLEGIIDLASEGAWALALILGLFSLVLPAMKFFICAQELDGKTRKAYLAFIHSVGFMSMAEVVFVSVLALTLKELPGGTEVTHGRGLWCYLLSVLLLSGLTAHLYMSERKGAEP